MPIASTCEGLAIQMPNAHMAPGAIHSPVRCYFPTGATSATLVLHDTAPIFAIHASISDLCPVRVSQLMPVMDEGPWVVLNEGPWVV